MNRQESIDWAVSGDGQAAFKVSQLLLDLLGEVSQFYGMPMPKVAMVLEWPGLGQPRLTATNVGSTALCRELLQEGLTFCDDMIAAGQTGGPGTMVVDETAIQIDGNGFIIDG